MITLLLELVLKIVSSLLAAPPCPSPLHIPSGGCEIPGVPPLPSIYLIYFLIIHVSLYFVRMSLKASWSALSSRRGQSSPLTVAFVAGGGLGGAEAPWGKSQSGHPQGDERRVGVPTPGVMLGCHPGASLGSTKDRSWTSPPVCEP